MFLHDDLLCRGGESCLRCCAGVTCAFKQRRSVCGERCATFVDGSLDARNVVFDDLFACLFECGACAVCCVNGASGDVFDERCCAVDCFVQCCLGARCCPVDALFGEFGGFHCHPSGVHGDRVAQLECFVAKLLRVEVRCVGHSPNPSNSCCGLYRVLPLCTEVL